MGDRLETDEVNEELAAEQVETLKAECDKGWFEDFDESMIITIIGSNTTSQNALVAQLYEKAYSVSLSKDLKGKCGDRLHYALDALLLTKPDFIAMRLHDSFKGWSTDKDLLTRLLGGLDGHKMMGVTQAYETKYTQPLWSALKAELHGDDFISAGLTWLRALEEPSRGAEKFTDVDVDSLEGDVGQLVTMLDYLLLEHDSLLVFVAYLDVEVIREATKGRGTQDTPLIRAFATRNKRALARVNIGYREAYGEPLGMMIDRELLQEGSAERDYWYAYLAKFLVVQEEQADSMILDLAMDGDVVDHQALVEFLCGRHPKRVRAAKERWEQSHDDSLVDKLSDSTAGDMCRLALRLLKGKRDTAENSDVDPAAARKQAHQLHDGGADFVEALCDNSPAQNDLVAKAFEEAYDTSLRRAIAQDYSGPVKNALQALLIGPSEWYVHPNMHTHAHAWTHVHTHMHACTRMRMRMHAHACIDEPMTWSRYASQRKAAPLAGDTHAHAHAHAHATCHMYSMQVDSMYTCTCTCTCHMHRYASQLKAALSGETVDDKAVCRIIGAHDKDAIAKIARAYDKKYGISLKSAVTNACKGGYRRLAVAWIDLPDQLIQPEKKIDSGAVDAVNEATGDEGTGTSIDDEISDEDEGVLSRPDV